MSVLQLLKRVWSSFWFKRLFEFTLCIAGIVLFSYFISEILYYLLLGPKTTSVVFDPLTRQTDITKTTPSLEHFFTYIQNVFHPSNIQIKLSYGNFGYIAKTYSFPEYIQGMYQPSITLLLISVVATVFLGLLLSYVYVLVERWFKKALEGIAIFIESIPDLMWIYLFILFFIWIYQKTGWRPFQVVSFAEQAWVGPIVCMTIVPMFQAFRMIILFTKQEIGQMYVEYAYSRGFSKSYIVVKHVLRNILKSLLNQFSLIYIFIVSSLFIVESVFNIRGIMRFYLEIYKTNAQPELFCLWMIMLFVPFYLIRTFFEYLVFLVLGAEAYE
ncbi:MAG: binding-protein-dependent transport system inner rane component [Bacillales bacterium]|nr:binding-protein-dependent transport system inner rane component [Bacillales bacterium]